MIGVFYMCANISVENFWLYGGIDDLIDMDNFLYYKDILEKEEETYHDSTGNDEISDGITKSSTYHVD